MRPQPGGPRLSPRRDKPAYAFTAPRGLPPKDSRACCTPWSVFQDGSDAAIRTPTTSARVVVSSQSGLFCRSRALYAVYSSGSLFDAGTQPTEVGPRRSVRRTANAFLGRLQTATRPGCTVSTQAQSHLPRRAPSRRQPPLAGSSRKCKADAKPPTRPAEPKGFHGPPGPRADSLSPTSRRFSCIRFPPNGFAVFLTLFSKYFSPFPHGTCSLSVSCRYLALDGVYHPLWAAFPNNPTLRRQWQPGPAASLTGLSPSLTRLSRPTSTAPTRDNGCLSRPQFSDALRRGFQARAVPTSLAVTEGILVSFFSSAY